MDRPCKKDPSSSKVAESTKTIVKYLLLVIYKGPAIATSYTKQHELLSPCSNKC